MSADSTPKPNRQNHRRIFLDAHGAWPHPCHSCGESIDGYARPADSASSVIHHIDGNHWNNALANLVPMHRGCHQRWHNLEPQKRLFSFADAYVYREIFFASAGPGPWPCCFCGETITEGKGRRGECLDVHHLDENPTNNQPANLVAIHRKCHTKLHKTGVARSAEDRAKISAAHKGIIPSVESRAKMSAAQKGKTLSLETRTKMSAALMGNSRSLGYKHSPEVRAKMSAAMIGNSWNLGRKHSADARANMSAAQKGRTISWGDKISAAMKGTKHSETKTFACQHCGRELRGSLLSRHERACAQRP